MPERLDNLSQDPAEDSDWDRLVLGEFYTLYERLHSDRSHDAGAVRDLLAQAARLDRLSPLGQVLLANALSEAIAGAGIGPQGPGPSGEVAGRPDLGRSAALGSSRVHQSLRTAAPVLAAAVARFSGDTQLTLPWIGGETGRTWAPVGALYLSQLTAQFDDAVSTLLHFAGAIGRFADERRQRLNGLLFHPLQNADQHGRRTRGAPPFGGIAARIVNGYDAEPPSFVAYRDHLGRRLTRPPTAYLEIVVHDNGVGIARHYYEAKRRQGDPDLEALPLFHEWQTLYSAFERHQSSKPVAFRRATTRPGAGPGIGLGGLLHAVKHLRAYLELRTGRLRAFQWFSDDEVIAHTLLLKPAGLPAEAPRLPGTVFRIFVPLDESRS
jgi:hypothetical protein